MSMASIAAMAPVIPVLTIDKVSDAVPLAQALVKGGLPVLEVTLRTEAALDAIKAIVREVPEAIVGAGTVLTEYQLGHAIDLGIRFAVSPGCTVHLAEEALERHIPFLPGVQTVSEAMELSEQGFRLLKFFPAEQAGGIGWLKSVGAPLADLHFCPTGGITAANAPAYLALPNVACVGGSWVAPKKSIEAGDWIAIKDLAFAAARLGHTKGLAER